VSEEQPNVNIGRSEDSDLVVKDSLISRLHARVEYRRGKFMLVDLSTNGTCLVNSQGEELYVRRDSIQIKGRGTRKHNFLEELFDEGLKEGVTQPQLRNPALGTEIAAALANEAVHDPGKKVTLDMIEAAPGYADRAALIRNFVRQDPDRAALVVRDLIRADMPAGAEQNG